MRERNKEFLVPSRRLKRVLLFSFLWGKRGLCYLEIGQMIDYIKKTSGEHLLYKDKFFFFLLLVLGVQDFVPTNFGGAPTLNELGNCLRPPN